MCLDGLSIPLYQLAWKPEETNIKGSTDQGKHRGKTREAMIGEGQREAREGVVLTPGKHLWKQWKHCIHLFMEAMEAIIGSIGKTRDLGSGPILRVQIRTNDL